MFNARAYGGFRVEELADHFEVTPQWARQILREETRHHIDQLELNLLVARREGNFIGLVIPAAAESHQNAVVHYLHWVLAQHAERDIDIEVHYRPIFDGSVAFFLEDVTEYAR